MIEKRSIHKEESVHGERWSTIHNGYFSDAVVASPFLDAIEKIINISHPGAIADLGGGTGFILSELHRRLELPGIRLFNVDISPEQLSINYDKQIGRIQTSVSHVTRHQLQADDRKLLLISRSLLHYFDRSGIRHLLKHIRGQLRKGEFFVHQSACFQSSKDAECLNLVYSLIGTDKWYGTVGEMLDLLREEGWEVCSISPAPKLHLNSKDLSERYKLSSDQVEFIRSEVERYYGQRGDIFIINNSGFDAWLHYRIFICKAI